MRLRIQLLLAILLFSFTAMAAVFPGGSPSTTNNDDSCDISLLPAATLLLPWFEVDLSKPAGTGETTLFSVTNVTHNEQVARVTLWTDRSFPVITFNIYLTGYDVQSINLYDVIRLGAIAPTRGTGWEDNGSPEGDFSGDNPLVARETCRNLPMQIRSEYITRMTSAFTTGNIPAIGSIPACPGAGGVHANASGYVTIDVVRTCAATQPTEPAYWSDEVLFDNVLMGDYLQIDGTNNFAQGNPMVHIRAIPEGGTAAQRIANPDTYKTNFRDTFYGRLQPLGNKVFDARQPLPSTFAARWIDGGPGGFQTTFKMWREPLTGVNAACGAYEANSRLEVAETVRFDEEENFAAFASSNEVMIPPAARVDVGDAGVFPPEFNDATAGWMYLNLDDPNVAGEASQAWVISSMRAQGRFSVDSDVVAFGNGCSPAVPSSEASEGEAVIGPANNINP